jgi:hypothetical protein
MTVKADNPSSPGRTRVMVAIFFFVSGFGFSTWASRIPTIQQQLHLNEAQLGAVLFALPIGLMATLPLTGVLLSRFDSRRIMMIGAIFFNLMLCLHRLCYTDLGTGHGPGLFRVFPQPAQYFCQRPVYWRTIPLRPVDYCSLSRRLEPCRFRGCRPGFPHGTVFGVSRVAFFDRRGIADGFLSLCLSGQHATTACPA